MRGMNYSVQRHAKTLQIEYQMKKKKNLGLYILSEPINSAHCLEVQEHHTLWINASCGYSTGSRVGGRCFVPQHGKGGQQGSHRNSAESVFLQGDYQEAWGFLPSFGKHFQDQMSGTLSFLQGLPRGTSQSLHSIREVGRAG